MIVAWTGHRPELFLEPSAAQAVVDALARDLVEHEAADHFLVGGQRGVDTRAALAAIALGVPFTLILPVPAVDFADGWAQADRDALDATVARATRLDVVGGEPTLAFTERDRRLATASDVLMAVWTGIQGAGRNVSDMGEWAPWASGPERSPRQVPCPRQRCPSTDASVVEFDLAACRWTGGEAFGCRFR
jgi:hypothetical protein